MKLLFLLLLPFMALSQPPKKARKILISNVEFSQIVTSLLDDGYKIDKIEKEYQTIKTERRGITPGSGWFLLINVRVKDSVAIFTGECGFDLSASNRSDMTFEIVNSGGGGSVTKQAFDKMDKFVKQFNKSVSYE